MLDNSSLDILNDLMFFYDEPIADISIIPTYQVSKLAAKYNKAVLSGEGADELFAGYTWHREYLWNVTKAQIKDSKKWGWELPINNFDIDSYSNAMAMGKFDTDELKQLLNPKFHKYIPDDTKRFYRKYFDENIPTPKRFQIMDIKCFMGELVLTKVDRASMANSLEVRVPFLNSDLCKKMLTLDNKVYFNKKKQKIILYKILKKSVPSIILKRKNKDLLVRINTIWILNGIGLILKNSKLVEAGIINRQTINLYLENKDHWRLWKLAVLEKWFEKWIFNSETHVQ